MHNIMSFMYIKIYNNTNLIKLKLLKLIIKFTEYNFINKYLIIN